MSLASKVGQVVYQRKSGVYMPMLQCDKGDLYQEYQGDPQRNSRLYSDISKARTDNEIQGHDFFLRLHGCCWHYP